jgi:pyruvate kinase
MKNSNSDFPSKNLDIFGVKQNLLCSYDNSHAEEFIQQLRKNSENDETKDIDLLTKVYDKDNQTPSDNISSDEEDEQNTTKTKPFTDLNKLCFLNHQKHTKHKIILNISKLKDLLYSDYFDALIESGANLLKIPFNMFDEKNFEELKISCCKLKEQMKIKNMKVPIMISLEYKLMRLENTSMIEFKKGEIVNFAFDPLKNQNDSNKTFNIISNYEYMRSNKLTPEDKILVDFGAGIFYVKKIFYKNGTSISTEKEENEIKKELNARNIFTYTTTDEDEKFVLNYRDLQIYENSENSTIFNSEHKFLDFVDNVYSGRDFNNVNKFEDEDIDYIEAITQFDCIINPNRPVQILKKLKYDKYNYIPDNFFLFGERVLKEIDFEYLVLDYVNPYIFEYFSEIIKNSKKTIPIITKIFELNTIKYIDYISKYSSAVIISFNNLVKDFPFLNIVIMTKMLISIFKIRGLAVYVHLQFLETFKNKMRPLPSAITDLLMFIENGVDGFNLGSDTFFNLTQNYNSIVLLREYIIEFMKLLPAAVKLKLIEKSTLDTENLLEINSISLYNSLTNNEKIIVVLISDDEKFLKNFLSNNLYNHVVLVTNKLNILKKFYLFSISHIILVKEISCNDEDRKEKLEKPLVDLVKADMVVNHLLKRHESSLLYVKCLKGENFEVFDLI